MSQSSFTRRRFLFSASTLLAGTALAACGAQPAAPTAAPKTEAKPAAGATTAPASAATKPVAEAKPAATSAAASQPKTAGAPATVGVAVRGEPVGAGAWQRAVIEQYTKANPNIKIEMTEVPYAEMDKKQLAWLATNTMPDLTFSGIKWFHYSAFKGAFMALDDMVKTKDPDMTDFFKAAVAGCQQDGKLYALPIEVNTGNQNIIAYNKDLLAQKGIPEPTPEWTWEDFATVAAQASDPSAKVYGTNFLTTNYYDFAALARCYGGDLLSDDAKQFTLTTDEGSVKAAKWQTELRTKLQAAPPRAEAEAVGANQAFAGGQIAYLATGIYNVVPLKEIVADKFKYDVLIGPKGPNQRGYQAFIGMYSIYAKSKVPQQAYDILTFYTSKDMAKLSLLEYGYSPARQSVWMAPEVQSVAPVFARAAEWMADPKNEGPFPMPYNLRFAELQDKWGNLAPPVFYGEVPFEEGMKKLQEECAQIVSLPRG